MVYFIKQQNTDLYKIGHSADPVKRLTQLQTGSPEKLLIVKTYPGGEELETHFHEKFLHLHVRGGWFKDESDEIRLFLRSGQYKPTNLFNNKESMAYPCCGNQCHRLITSPSGDEYNHVMGIDTVPLGYGRGSIVKIQFYEEAGNDWDLCFGFHKGQTFSWIEVLETGERLETMGSLPRT